MNYLQLFLEINLYIYYICILDPTSRHVHAEIEAEAYVNEQIVRNNSVYVPVSAIFLFTRISGYLLFVVVFLVF